MGEISKTCFKCNITYPLSNFSKNKSKKSGHNSECKLCKSIQDKEWRIKNLESKKIKDLNYKKINKEKLKIQNKKYYEDNKDIIYLKNREYQLNNIEKTRKYKRDYEKRNPLKMREAAARRRAKKFMAAIDYDKYKSQIIEIYENCPIDLTVDHIIPLAGKNVCGLHVPWNLQYLTLEENSRKGNRGF